MKGIKRYKSAVIIINKSWGVIYSIKNMANNIVITLNGDGWLLDLQ